MLKYKYIKHNIKTIQQNDLIGHLENNKNVFEIHSIYIFIYIFKINLFILTISIYKKYSNL